MLQPSQASGQGTDRATARLRGAPSPAEGLGRGSPAPPVGSRALCVPPGLLKPALGERRETSPDSVQVGRGEPWTMCRGLVSSRGGKLTPACVPLKHRKRPKDLPQPCV